MADASEVGTEWVPRFGILEVPAERAAFIRGLFELAAWVADHPEVPLPYVTGHVPTPLNDWDAERAFVDRVAPAFGAEPELNQDGSHYRTDRMFGPVEITCVAIDPDYMEAFRQHSAATRAAVKADRAAAAGEVR
jgi:hypothetical protein